MIPILDGLEKSFFLRPHLLQTSHESPGKFRHLTRTVEILVISHDVNDLQK